jgi:phage tail-like protein
MPLSVVFMREGAIMANRDVYSNFNFKVEVDGIPQVSFSEVELPETSIEVIDYREGAEFTTRKLPGLRKFSNLTLRRGVTTSNELFDWYKSTGPQQRRNVVVQLLDDEQNPVKRWAMRNVWPVRYAVSPLIAVDGCIVVTETLECAVEQFEAESP